MNQKIFKRESVICIFGDSISYGACDFEKSGWANRLRSLLEDKMMKDKNKYFIVYNCSIPGNTTNDLLKRFEVECESRRPDIIIFSIGLCDSQFLNKENKPKVALDKFENNLNKIIKLAKKYSSNILFIGITPVNENYTTPLIRDSNRICKNILIENYNNTLKRTSRSFIFLDIYNQWIRINYRNLLFDGVHPNAEGHKKIFEELSKLMIRKKII